MFNSKLKKQIEDLEIRLWKLENKPSYKIGDKLKYFKDYIVTKVEFKKDSYTLYLGVRVDILPKRYKYTIVNTKTGETKII